MWKVYCTPTTLDDALSLLAEHGPQARVIAGGTDLLIELQRGVRRLEMLVDITRIAGLDRVYVTGDGWVHIGPNVTHHQVVASPLLVQQAFPLALACWRVGTPQLRNRGTVAGNLITASPANDTITALWALDARLVLRSARGTRVLSLPDFYRGVRQTELAPDEMVTEIVFPRLSADQRGTFVKLALRRTHAIAVVNVAAVLTFDRGTVARARITLGSVAPTIIRAVEAENALTGQPLCAESIAEAAELAAGVACPIDDVRSSASYRCDMVRVLVRRALVALQQGTERDAFPAVRPPMLWGKGDGRFTCLSGPTVYHRAEGPEPIEFTVNGEPVRVVGAGGKTLLQMLRDDLRLTGTKEGCGEGECGACTVWMDGITVLACMVPAPRVHGTHVVTVEGLEREGKLHPLQQAFIDAGAVQCGYCTPGFIMAGASLLEEIERPSREQILAGLTGNLCRCTGYYKIVEAVERAARSKGGDARQGGVG